MAEVDRSKMQEQVIFHLSKIAKVDQNEIKMEDHLRDDLGLDSLSSMELMARVSDDFEVDVEFEDLQEVETVNDILDFLTNLVKQK